MAGGSTPGASLVDRTLAVIGSFDDSHRRQRLTELADRSGLSAPTALRIVRRLVAKGALQRDPDGAYFVGRMLWEIGLLAPVQTGLRESAAPFLHDLQAATRATVHLAVRDDDRVLYLDRLSGSAAVPVISRVGSRLPLHSTGVGKVLLAHAPADVQRRVLSDLRRHTPYTIVAAGTLNRQLERVRREGYAITQEEMTLGACSVAVPIRGGDDQVIAALGLVVVSLTRDRARHVAALSVAAAGITRQRNDWGAVTTSATAPREDQEPAP